ncbi:hypothetical protein DFH08DRAFT_821597 [Mycena albidolilacea]|uniref:Uncharacterized protein n=1 Tax=Mycena albidolilacea TaxID=1033008 RepID=A0AAD7EDE5_9AGAR|nr:hypothetical protein DFH08DRAFT_821597 [Mycena albidolilacea]
MEDRLEGKNHRNPALGAKWPVASLGRLSALEHPARLDPHRNVTLGEAGTSTSTGDKYTSTWHSFNASFPALVFHLVIYDEAEARPPSCGGKAQGPGFVVQDGVTFSTTSCVSQDKTTARFDVAIRNGLSPTCVYLEQISTDSVDRVFTTEIDIAPPSQPVAINSAYSLWNINLPVPDMLYAIGTEVDGVKYSTTDLHRTSDSEFVFSPC